ncbi:glycoside hydrolase family 55 protein [Cercospora zeae-maydis SCOH1-5]|uniref:Glycoside hydrolase family 55 protein n=1 Tax=Cercospora zeae-maydis SCOH1-5 TaxID=717836 RepID=A0A6A6FQG3_9PEZI|nr:glycoside hydrolase family 55 protein [Cercospora zeae-maydis SCOH1-5]
MHIFRTITLLSAVGSTVVHAQLLQIPSIQQIVDQTLRTFDDYVEYDGVTPQQAQRAPAASAPARVNVAAVSAANSCDDYWMQAARHQGIAAFNSNPSAYQVFRNVKDFGARGDGVTDDTRAINNAISSGNRCAPGACGSSTTTPAVVYFPTGVYMVNASIIDYYYTQMIGNPKPGCMPTIRAAPTFTGGLGVIDGNQYGANGLGYGATNVFWRQIRNLIIDTTLVPAANAITGLHWPTAQATSLQNLVFNMNSQRGTQHQGIFIEEGSGGFMNDLVFNGGLYGANWGNQQFTSRNLTFRNCVTAINQIWDWGWTYKSININNCTTGINMTNGAPNGLNIGSLTILDSTISNTRVGINTGRTRNTNPPTAGGLVVENVRFNNVPVAIRGPEGTRVGNVQSIAGYIEGHAYTPTGPTEVQQSLTPNARPSVLLQSDGKYYERSKPQYENLPLSSFVSARTAGARGDGRTDDTSALQNAINSARSQNKILFLDHGNYIVTNTIYIPAGSKIVGETFSVIMSSGSFFNNITNPQPVVQIGRPGERGSIEWSDCIVSTLGQQKGAVMIQYNLVAPAGTPTGLWDVHVRIGGFAGSRLLVADCPKTPNTQVTPSLIDQDCISGYLSMHITNGSTGLYLENVWLWVADHDIEDRALTQITIYTGRGLLDQSQGPVWMIGTGVEHHVRYEYQFASARNVFAGQIQTETAYYQPNPNARNPFPAVSSLADPSYNDATIVDRGTTIPAANGWGLRIKDSSDILIYGAGLYSFFNNYSTQCSNQGSGAICQSRIASIEGTNTRTSIYNLNTVGTRFPFTVDGQDRAYWSDNQGGFTQGIALVRNRGGV